MGCNRHSKYVKEVTNMEMKTKMIETQIDEDA